MNPELLISGGKIAESTACTVEKPPDTGELLKNLTADVSEAVEALQDGTDLLVQQAQHLLLHESVMAGKDAPGHFRAGLGFEFNAITGCHNVVGTFAFEESMGKLEIRLTEAMKKSVNMAQTFYIANCGGF